MQNDKEQKFSFVDEVNDDVSTDNITELKKTEYLCNSDCSVCLLCKNKKNAKTICVLKH